VRKQGSDQAKPTVDKMDSYPGDLLAGVFPLVFAVDAILPSPSSHIPFKDEEGHKSSEEEGQKEETESSNAADDAVQVEKKPHLSSTQTRSLFDRFLDVAAAGLVDEEQSVQQSVRSSLGSRNGNGGDNTSDDEDDFSSYTDNTSRRGSFRRNSPIKAFHNKRRHTMSTNSTAFARVLSTETFFQRARVLSVSIRHGFPPSKDPEGAKNRTIVLSQARAAMTQGATGANALRLKNFVENQPSPDGILPSGWLEKHVHALPSVLLVVTTCSSRDQEEQNKYFLETMEHLKESMAPKRECHIHVVCLVENEPSISVFTTDAWITMARHYTELPPTSITLLSTNDLKVDIPTSIDFRVLIITIRDASLSYYLQQARRAKKKHAVLGHEQQPKLLPLAARYCFKIGIFYEFQLKHEKSLKFFALSYRYTQLYYQFLLNGSPLPPDVVNPQEHHIPQVTDEEAESDYETGIEVSLADASDEEEERKEEVTPMPPPTELKKVVSSGEAPYDMTHQCRAVADWLNFKILQAGFMATALGETDGLLAASWQWRKHAQVMLRNDDHTNPCLNYWSFVVHQRLVMSQLVERHPPSGEGVPEEVLIRCSPWRNYLAAAEAELNLDAELQKELSNDASLADKLGGRSMRQKFVGRLDSDGLFPKLHKESKKNHTGMDNPSFCFLLACMRRLLHCSCRLADNALTLIARAIELFEREVDKTAKKDSEHGEEEKRPFLPSGARLYYMRGGILLHLQRYQDAILNLKKAARHCTKWDGLQDFIRQMLVACYDKCMPPLDEAADSSDMLDTLFHSGLGLQDLRRLLDSYSSVRGNDALKWQVECQGESDTLSPFSFSVTFPGSTHATAGDTVTASIAIRSNLNYSAHVKSVTLWSMSGQITVPSSDLAIAENADKGIEGGILVHPKTVVSISTDFGLPADLDKIAPAGSGGSSDHDGKGSSAATARPRIAGVCSGGE
jgi:tetratricopeptide (TPR) repeat protein